MKSFRRPALCEMSALFSNSIVSLGLERNGWERIYNLWRCEAVFQAVNRSCLVLITKSWALPLWSLVNWLIVELSEQSCWESRDLQTQFPQPQTAPGVASVASCATFLWVGLKFGFREELHLWEKEKKTISLLQSAISLYISRRDYTHRSSAERTLFYAIQWAPACHFLEKIGCWNFGSSPQCITECFLQPGEQPDSQTTSVLKNCDFFSLHPPTPPTPTPPQLQSTLKIAYTF